MNKILMIAGTVAAAGVILASTAINVMAADITEDRAKEIVLKDAGVKEKDVIFIKAETDYENGQRIYDIEFVDKNNREYDYEIGIAEGNILSYDYDAEHYSPADGTEKENEKISMEQAKETALKQAGADISKVSFFKIKEDRDDGRFVYEGEFVYNDMEYEFEIDSRNGSITDWDVESIYD